VFYFYFDDKAAGLGKGLFGTTGRVSNPKQFTLLKLDVHSKTRETTIGAFGIFGGNTGTDSNALIPFASEQIRPGLYKVTLNHSLQPAEYCFMASNLQTGAYNAGSAGAVDIFDFGFSPEKKTKN
jgi:hypothetical protein